MPGTKLSRISHERLAYFFVLSLYIAGMLLVSLLIIQVVSWGLLSSFGTLRMLGLLLSLASTGFLISRLIAGHYGNRLAARLSPRVLDYAVSVRRLMGDFQLHNGKELKAFVSLHKLRVYSSRRGYSSDYARQFACTLEPLFTHDMYLPWERNLLIRHNRLWFNGQELEKLINKQQKLFASVDYAWMDNSSNSKSTEIQNQIQDQIQEQPGASD